VIDAKRGVLQFWPVLLVGGPKRDRGRLLVFDHVPPPYYRVPLPLSAWAGVSLPPSPPPTLPPLGEYRLEGPAVVVTVSLEAAEAAGEDLRALVRAIAARDGAFSRYLYAGEF
jgi:hypothetical protein